MEVRRVVEENQGLKVKLECAKDEIEVLKKKREKMQFKNDTVMKRQTDNIQQLVTAAQNMQNKIKSYKAEKEGFEAKIAQLSGEKKDSLRYTELIELRFKEISMKEEEANQKVLSLLDEVEKLTKENQELLKQMEARGLYQVDQ